MRSGCSTHTHTYTHPYSRTHTRTYTHTHIHTHAHTHAHTRAHTHTRTHARTHTHTHTQHTQALFSSLTRHFGRSQQKVRCAPSPFRTILLESCLPRCHLTPCIASCPPSPARTHAHEDIHDRQLCFLVWSAQAALLITCTCPSLLHLPGADPGCR